MGPDQAGAELLIPTGGGSDAAFGEWSRLAEQVREGVPEAADRLRILVRHRPTRVTTTSPSRNRAIS